MVSPETETKQFASGEQDVQRETPEMFQNFSIFDKQKSTQRSEQYKAKKIKDFSFEGGLYK